jgi:hypothetical protein
VRTPDGRIQIGDVSNAGAVVTVKRGDKDVRVWTAIWYSLAPDGTDWWHSALRTGYLTTPIAARVAALSLHHFDISFYERILKEYQLKFVNEYSDVSLALWIAVVTKIHVLLSALAGAVPTSSKEGVSDTSHSIAGLQIAHGT